AALSKYGTCLAVCDVGTASKVIFLDKEGEFAGIAIAPGLKMSGRALKEKTAALPELPLGTPEHAIGRNTNEALLSGISYGAACLLKGMAEQFEKEAGYPLRWVLTGGDAKYIKDLLPEFAYDESLTLDGLNLIYQRTHS
ncbi:MAG: type III pantothenate kinase, partial [Bacilli bacterium]|nr:type III pantothenate kinase [Bacilli bacterium]